MGQVSVRVLLPSLCLSGVMMLFMVGLNDSSLAFGYLLASVDWSVSMTDYLLDQDSWSTFWSLSFLLSHSETQGCSVYLPLKSAWGGTGQVLYLSRLMKSSLSYLMFGRYHCHAVSHAHSSVSDCSRHFHCVIQTLDSAVSFTRSAALWFSWLTWTSSCHWFDPFSASSPAGRSIEHPSLQARLFCATFQLGSATFSASVSVPGKMPDWSSSLKSGIHFSSLSAA